MAHNRTYKRRSKKFSSAERRSYRNGLRAGRAYRKGFLAGRTSRSKKKRSYIKRRK